MVLFYTNEKNVKFCNAQQPHILKYCIGKFLRFYFNSYLLSVYLLRFLCLVHKEMACSAHVEKMWYFFMTENLKIVLIHI